ncbi:hypothetical protein CKO28_07490 [Rhodovibrio sodomensis]|uniref:ABC-type transport auxiliary lipoprotein component domain-containing protein n=1 Tax=Rhodovibrio sodomensis TaxID=1088 RepID=A0ABS1DBN9_9PROT|nr:hypothetical protein [Rhodovibrio sodomensis]MBK1667876.1 hypothetical protein [Rhodovibrio sodomensis]
MSAPIRALASLVLALPLLAACTTPPQEPKFADITFAHRPDIEMDVGDIVVKQDYDAPMAAPNVDHLFPIQPARALMSWGQDRLVAMGDDGVATYTVTDASAVAEDLETDDSLSDYFTTEQAERYTLKMAVRLSVDHPDGTGSIRVTGQRATTVPEGASVFERERIWYQMTEKLMADMDEELEVTLREELSRYVLSQ